MFVGRREREYGQQCFRRGVTLGDLKQTNFKTLNLALTAKTGFAYASCMQPALVHPVVRAFKSYIALLHGHTQKACGVPFFADSRQP